MFRSAQIKTWPLLRYLAYPAASPCFPKDSLVNTASVKYMYLKFAIIQSVLFIFTKIQMQTEIPKYETYRTGFNFYSPPPPPPPPGGKLKGMDRGQNSSFLEYGHVAYQIKEDSTCQQHGSK